MSKKIILENKKATAMRSFVRKYPALINMASKIFDFDTPEGKYAQWIDSKYHF